MEHREANIFRLLLQSDGAFYIPEDKSDLYALAPPDPATGATQGLFCIPGEYLDMPDEAIPSYALDAMRRGAWKFIPLED